MEEGRLVAERYILNKRAKGEMGETLKSLVYAKRIKLGKEAYEEGRKRRKAPGKDDPRRRAVLARSAKRMQNE